jgi:hypothetical protein
MIALENPGDCEYELGMDPARICRIFQSPKAAKQPGGGLVGFLNVAQIGNLPFRRIASCGASARSRTADLADVLPITNRRYGRLPVCATTKYSNRRVGVPSGWMHARWGRTLLLALFLAVGFTFAASAADETGQVNFTRDIQPIISTKCYSCHGQDDSARKSKLRLDQRDEAIKERKGTFPIKPGDPEHSELLLRVTSKDPDEVMPPPKTGHHVTELEVALLKRWIQQGAPYAGHWAFIKPVRPGFPKVKDHSWPKSGLDHFILAKLEAAGLKPSPPADRYTLARRLSLDLTGLPPTPTEVDLFVNDTSPDAYEKLVDRLLALPAYGERWARPWLDLARYADSSGFGSDPLRLNIWPWRDWVINALNRNMPFDQFTLEQLAGDLLPNPTEEQLIATAFHRNTMTNTEGGTDDEEFRVAAVKDRANATAQVWMGLTMGCAQCHTHKYDPITQREYYQFYAFFNATEDNDQPDERPTLPLPTKAQREKMDRLKTEIAAVEKERAKSTPEFEKELVEWEAGQKKTVDWTVLEPIESKSSGSATLANLPDHSILASGTSPTTDTYTVKVRTDLTNLTAFRLELLPHDSLPKNGPGRASDTGKLLLNEIQVAVRSPKSTPPLARFLRIELPGTPQILSLAEVQVWSDGENVALKGKANQSSTQNSGEAARAIDGNTEGDFADGSTTLTKAEDNPWWEVDFGTNQPLEELAIWNRTDRGLGTRLTDFKVLALDAERKTVWERRITTAPNPVASLRVPEEKAVRLRNASADFSERNNDAAKAIDGDMGVNTGWSVGAQTGRAHAASFEIETNAPKEAGSLLIFTLTQKNGGQQTIGRFRLSTTTQSRPARILPEKISEILAVAAGQRTAPQREALAGYFREFAPSVMAVDERLRKLKKDLTDVKPVAVPVMRELAADKRRESRLLNKGNFLDRGDLVEPGVPASFPPLPAGAPSNRLGVAQWLLSPDNPLTARVAANRFWSQLFGAGLVETEEDFGTQGQFPSHPDLLDWLAVEFRDQGWNMKQFLKTIVMSATYQQSSLVTPAALAQDPRNRLLAHFPRRRLDAEMVRDQALVFSGLFSRKIGGPSVYPTQPDGLWRAAFNGERTWATSKGEDRYRRGLYTFWRRTVPYPSMATFDAPSRETCTFRRLPTNTPLQAFVTLNDPVFVEAAQALGRRLMREGGGSVADRARWGLQLTLARPPEEAQVQELVKLYEAVAADYQGREKEARRLATEPLGPLPEGVAPAEAAAWTAVANVLLNLDGVLSKS